MEITFNNSKEELIKNKPPKLILNYSNLNKKIPQKTRSKTYENNSSINTSKDSNKGILLINSSYFRKAKEKKIYENPKKRNKNEVVYKYKNHSYFKDSLGSIPAKSEKILLSDKIDNSDRFSGVDSSFNKIRDNIPGVGTYNLDIDWNLKNNGVLMENSEEKRFNDDSDYSNYYPCVGYYNAYNGENYEKAKNNLRYDSLYIRTRILFNENTYKKADDKGFIYNPKNINDILNNKKKFNFDSYSSRNDFRGSKIPNLINNKNTNPGPDKYFNEVYFELKNKNGSKSSGINQSTYTDFKYTKGKNVLNKKIKKIIFSGLSPENIDKPSFIMKQNGNIKNNKVYNLEDIYRFKNDNINSGKNLRVNLNEVLDKKLKENEINNTSKKLYYSMEQDKELEKIKKILGNDNGKPDFFYLSPDRWNKRKKKFTAPGPAYYFYNTNI